MEELRSLVGQQGDEFLFPTSLGWAVADWSKAEWSDAFGVALWGIPVTVGSEYATTVWIGEDEGEEQFLVLVDYWLARLGGERLGLSSSPE